MTLALRYRVIEKRNFHGSMEMSFFVSFPISNALPGPDKSGHRPAWCILVKSALHVCPDLRGTLMPPVKGHEIKKDISILFSILDYISLLDFIGGELLSLNALTNRIGDVFNYQSLVRSQGYFFLDAPHKGCSDGPAQNGVEQRVND